MPFCRHSSSITIFRVFAAVASLLVLSPTTPLKAEGPGFVAVAKSYLSRAMKSISDRFGDDSAKGGPKAKDPDQVAKMAGGSG